jgi:hypothetical protein
MKTKIQGTLQLAYIIKTTNVRCFWCGQQLRQCGICHGSGKFKNENCKPCLANGWICPTHEGDWSDV